MLPQSALRRTLARTSKRTSKFITSLALALWSLVALAGKHEPLPRVEEKPPVMKSANEAVERMYIASNMKVPLSFQGKVIAEPDIVKAELAGLAELVNDTSVPNEQKRVVLIRYTMGDERMDAALIAAKNAGIRVTIVTDLNPVLAYEFKDKEPITIDFANAKIKSEEGGGATVKRLLAAGFVFGRDFYSQPLYNPEVFERTPIMHEKGLFLQAGVKKISYIGTANLARHPRFNRIFKFIEPAIFDAYLDHIDALIGTYSMGKETKNLPVMSRKRFSYPDGTAIELAFTDGRFNPNDRIVEVLGAGQIESWMLSHFAPTNADVVKEIGNQMKLDREIRGFMVTDDKFSDLSGWGVTNTLENMSVIRPFSSLHGMGEDIAKRVESYIWQKPAIDPDSGRQIFQTEEDGAPLDRDLWHDKTTLIVNKPIDGKRTVHVFSGSFNLSNNAVNSENQFQFTLDSESWLAKSIALSVRGTVELNPRFAVPALIAVVRSSLAKVFKVGVMDIALDDIQSLMKSIGDQDVQVYTETLRKISKSSTKMRQRLSDVEKEKRLEKLVKFFEWQLKTPSVIANFEVRVKRSLGVTVLLNDPKMSVGKRIGILKDITWQPGVTPEAQQVLVNELNSLFGFDPSERSTPSTVEKQPETQPEPQDENRTGDQTSALNKRLLKSA